MSAGTDLGDVDLLAGEDEPRRAGPGGGAFDDADVAEGTDAELEAGEDEGSEEDDAGSDGEAGPATSAPTADPSAPFKARIAELEQKAALAAEFEPYKDAIRERIRAGFSPADAKADVKETAKAAQEAGAPDPFADKERYAKWCEEAGENPALYRDTIQGLAAQSPAVKDMQKRLEAFEKKFGEREQHIDEVRGRLLLDRWSEANPDAKRLMPRVLDLVNKDGVKSFERALAIAKDEEELGKLRSGAAVAKPKAPVRKPVPPPSARPQQTRAPGGKGKGVRASEGSERAGSIRGGSVMSRAIRSAMNDIAESDE